MENRNAAAVVPVTFRIPLQQRTELRALLLRHGITLQDWGRCVVAEHLGLAPDEDVKGALQVLREAP